MNCQCGGLIMEPNRAYLYSGPVCHCQRPTPILASAQIIGSLGGITYTKSTVTEGERLILEAINKLSELLRNK